jgi:hypothetical protein
MAGNSAGFTQDDGVSFPIPLTSAPQEDFIAPGGASTANCPGSSANPAAAPGHLCYYATKETGATGVEELTSAGFPSKYGDVIFPTGVTANTDYQTAGIWAVTAP